MTLPIILASASPARLQLLRQVGIEPEQILPADIDECAKKGERGHIMAKRLAEEKAEFIASNIDQGIVIAADTVPIARGKIMRKSKNADDVRDSLKQLSGRRHQLYTGLCIIKKDNGEIRRSSKLVKSIIKFRTISDAEIEYFCKTGEGVGKAGGYTLNGHAESFVAFISGSFSNVIGLPLCETTNILRSFGHKWY